jgi:hypothetical protein
MNKKRSKVIYFILVLLILLVIAIIGGLAMVLFNMTFSSHSPTPIEPVTLHTNAVEYVTPLNETVIELKDNTTRQQQLPKPQPKAAASITPKICEGCGPQIKNRDAYKNPATYSASISPNHVHFTIYPKHKIKSKNE